MLKMPWVFTQTQIKHTSPIQPSGLYGLEHTTARLLKCLKSQMKLVET